jgi:hypothetical protein
MKAGSSSGLPSVCRTASITGSAATEFPASPFATLAVSVSSMSCCIAS